MDEEQPEAQPQPVSPPGPGPITVDAITRFFRPEGIVELELALTRYQLALTQQHVAALQQQQHVPSAPEEASTPRQIRETNRTTPRRRK